MDDRYQREQDRESISVYMIARRSNESAEQYFERARDECALRLRERAERIKAMSFSEFQQAAKFRNAALAKP